MSLNRDPDSLLSAHLYTQKRLVKYLRVVMYINYGPAYGPVAKIAEMAFS